MPALKLTVISALLLVHTFLFGWAIVGFAEWILPTVPWKPVSNPDFPRWVLFIHWTAILAGGGTFLFGYLTRWPGTPAAMAVAYGMMAAVCAIETFGFMTSPSKYIAMATEYITYAVLTALYFYAPFIRERFTPHS